LGHTFLVLNVLQLACEIAIIAGIAKIGNLKTVSPLTKLHAQQTFNFTFGSLWQFWQFPKFP
jgi:hypothetical protein